MHEWKVSNTLINLVSLESYGWQEHYNGIKKRSKVIKVEKMKMNIFNFLRKIACKMLLSKSLFWLRKYSFYFDLENTYEDRREKESLWLCQTVLLLLKII